MFPVRFRPCLSLTLLASILTSAQAQTTGSVTFPRRPAATVLSDTRNFRITDDSALTTACLRARKLFLDTEPVWQAGKDNRLDFTLLILNSDGTVSRGGHGQDNLAYPASCVKLPFMVAAMAWSRENGLPPTALDSAVSPMITVSSNEATGEVVDAITGANNLSDITTATEHRFSAWMDQRLYTEKYLAGRGLLGNQTILHKTYPSNSGRSPQGAEGVASRVFGGNRMQSRLSASLMLEIARGTIEPQAQAYMLQQLRHERFEDDSIVGWGLPPGSEYFNKPGVAYDTSEDIAYVRLPNGREFILAVYSNSWARTQPIPHDANRLGRFVEILLEETGLLQGTKSHYYLPAGQPGSALDYIATGAPQKAITLIPGTYNTVETTQSQWITGNAVKETTRILSTSATPLSWKPTTDTTPPLQAIEATLELPHSGFYELTAFHPNATDFATSVTAEVVHSEGTTTIPLNTKVAGRRPRNLGTYWFGAKPWKSPEAAPKPAPVKVTIRFHLPPGQPFALDAIRAQLWLSVPPKDVVGKAPEAN